MGSTAGTADSCSSPEVISGLGSFLFNNTGASTGTEGQTQSLCSFFGTPGIARDVWFRWTAPSTGQVTLSTCDQTSVDTKIAVYASTPTGQCPTASAIACNDDCCGYQSVLSFSCTAGARYLIQLGCYPGELGGVGWFVIAMGSPPSCPPATEIARYAFDSGNLGFDSSGNGHQATTSIGAMVPGICGGVAPWFFPTNNVQEFQVPDSNALDIVGDMSGMAWIKPLGAQSDGNAGCPEGTIMWKGGNYWFQVQKDNGQLEFQHEGSGNNIVKWPPSFTPNYIPVSVWTHVAFVRQGVNPSTIRFYKNGVYQGSQVLSGPVATANADVLSIGNGGCCPYQNFCEFNGLIDDVRLWSGALSDAEILEIASRPMTPPISITASATTVCAGNWVTLTANGGCGAQLKWSEGACGGVSIGSASQITVTPAATTTYFASYGFDAAFGVASPVCASITITVSTPPASPTSVSASPSSICAGSPQAVTLFATGVPAGVAVSWYTSSCGGAFVGTGNPYLISIAQLPSAGTTKYFARCDVSPCPSACNSSLSATLTVLPTLTAPTSPGVAPDSVCGGVGTITLTASPGVGSPSGSEMRWYEGCGGPQVGVANPTNNTLIIAAPTTNKSYVARMHHAMCGDGPCSSAVSVAVQSAPSNDECTSPLPLSVGSVSPNTTCATDSTGSGCLIKNDVWYRYVANVCGKAQVTFAGASLQPIVAAYQVTNCAGVSPTTLEACGPGSIQLDVSPGLVYFVQVGSQNRSTGIGTLSLLESDESPDNDACDQALSIDELFFNDPRAMVDGIPFSTHCANTDGPSHASCSFSGDAQIRQDIWFRYTATDTGQLFVSTCDAADFDTKIAVYDGIACPTAATLPLNCEDDSSGCGTTTTMKVPVELNHEYLIRVGGRGAAAGDGTLLLTCVPAFICPLDSGVSQVNTYNLLSGAASGGGWSWRIKATDNSFQPIERLHDADLDALAADASPALVAAAFAQSITEEAQARGCSATLTAMANPLIGSIPLNGTLSIQIDGADDASDFALWVGRDGQEPFCQVVVNALPTCNGAFLVYDGINIQELPLPGEDCNHNALDDLLEISVDATRDVDNDGVPDDCVPNPGFGFCFGDGSLPTSCPCAAPNVVPNPPAAFGHGCANSLSSSGAQLTAAGTASPDTVSFRVEVGTNYAGFGFLIKGDTRSPGGIQASDGIRCVTGQLIRFGGHNAGTNGAPLGRWTYPNNAQTMPVSTATAQPHAQTAYYQLFYRNATAGFCSNATANFSNGFEIGW